MNPLNLLVRALIHQEGAQYPSVILYPDPDMIQQGVGTSKQILYEKLPLFTHYFSQWQTVYLLCFDFRWKHNKTYYLGPDNRIENERTAAISGTLVYHFHYYYGSLEKYIKATQIHFIPAGQPLDLDGCPADGRFEEGPFLLEEWEEIPRSILNDWGIEIGMINTVKATR